MIGPMYGKSGHDPGSENKGVMPDTLAEFNVIDSSGRTDIHTDGAFIENHSCRFTREFTSKFSNYP